jgi:DNA repair exonuclease SbcCD ATPase subunit
MKSAITRLVEEKTEVVQDDAQSIKEFDMQTEEILSRANEMEAWLDELEKNTPNTTNDKLENLNDLFQVKSKFQALKESCEQMTVKFRELNEAGSETLLQGDDLIRNKRDSNFSQLAKQLTKLNARWNEVTSQVYARTAALEHLSAQYGELKTLIVSEAGYLDKLDKLLRRSPENAADAEEISEELDVIFRILFLKILLNFPTFFLRTSKTICVTTRPTRASTRFRKLVRSSSTLDSSKLKSPTKSRQCLFDAINCIIR